MSPAASAYRRTERNIRPVTRITSIPASRAAAIAASVRGRRTRSSAISVRSRSHASARTRRGKSGGSASGLLTGVLGDVRGDVGDLLLAELILERRHPAAAVRDLRPRRSRRRAPSRRGWGRPCRSTLRRPACGSSRNRPTCRPRRRLWRRPRRRPRRCPRRPSRPERSRPRCSAWSSCRPRLHTPRRRGGTSLLQQARGCLASARVYRLGARCKRGGLRTRRYTCSARGRKEPGQR